MMLKATFLRHCLNSLLAATLITTILTAPSFALTKLTDQSIMDAIQYGLKNQDMGLSFFLGPNWREGRNGFLLNIYTPYIEIARSAVTHKAGPVDPTDAELSKARKTIVEDASYIYSHPTVKFLCSMYGKDATFAKGYYADIEGVGRGRRVHLLPSKSVRQGIARVEKGATFERYSAINTYHFKYDDIAPLDELTFRLYGKDRPSVVFKIKTKSLL